MAVAQSLNLLSQDVDDDVNFGMPEIDSEFGGFVVTVLVAITLVGCASMAGLMAGSVLPFRWFKPSLNADSGALH